MPARPRTAPRKKPTQERAKVTVDAICDATAHVLVKTGYEGLSTNRVAERAGVSIGSLYQYFPSKEALVSELLERYSLEIHDMTLRMLAELESSEPETVTRTMVTAMIDLKLQNPALAKVLREQVPRVGRMKRLEDELDRIVVVVSAYLRAHASRMRSKDPDLAAFIAVHLVDHLTHQLVTQRSEVPRETAIEEITDLTLRYLVA